MKARAAKGGVWLTAARGLQVAFQLVSLVLVARYLDKTELGIASAALLLLALFSTCADMGMGVLGVQRPDPDEDRVALYAWLGGLGGTVLVSLLARPLSLLFDGSTGLMVLVWFGSPTLMCASLVSTARARLVRRMSFDRVAMLDTFNAAHAAFWRVALAHNGWGAASLILGDLLAITVGAMLYWIIAPRPGRGTPGPLLLDGLHVIGARLADILFTQLDRFYIAARMGLSQLGLYSFAYPHAMAAVTHGSPITEQVALPWFSRTREAGESLAEPYAAVTRIYALVALPFATAMWLAAPMLIDWIYPERWQEAVPILRALCVAAFCAGLNSQPGLVLLALGRMRLRLVWSLANVALLAIALPLIAKGDLLAVAYVLAGRSLLATIVAQMIVHRLIGLRHARYVFELLPGLIASIGVATLSHMALR